VSITISIGITFIIFLGFFIMLQLISYEYYANFLNHYNESFSMMMETNVTFIIIFIVIAFVLFCYRMNKITNYIKKISQNIHTLANGDFSEKLSIENKNELGQLARDINIMAEKTEEYIQKEKRFNDERYNMITNMSHDLKTPIMSIDGYAQLIKNKKYENSEELDKYCDIIARKSKELNLAINQIFELVKINANDFKIVKQTLHLREFIEQVLAEYIPQFEKEEMEYRIDLLEDIVIDADPMLMIRVFENIISNALKYAKAGKYLDIKVNKRNGKIYIYFINYGPKIEADDLQNIFHKYYREKKNVENEGSGLGLAIAKTIIELHGGTLKVSSSDEQTEFVVVFKSEI